MEQKKDSKKRNLRKGEDQLKDGKYRYRYTDESGKRRAVYSWKLVPTDRTPKGKKNGPCLRELEKNIERDIDDGILTYESSITSVYELVMKYISMKPQIANATKSNYVNATRWNIEDSSFGRLKIGNVKKSDVKRFYAYLYEEKNYAVGTIQLYQNLLFPAFQMAVDDDVLRKNPCKGCMKEYSKNGLSTTKYPLTRAEQRALLNYVNDDNVYSKYSTLIAFMLGTGCRVSETIGMTWDNIDLEKGEITVDHQIIYKKILKENRVRHYAAPPKNKQPRKIPLQKDLITILSKHKMQTYLMSKLNDYEVDGYSNFVFLNKEMRLYTPNTLSRTFRDLRNSYNKTRDESDGDTLLPHFTPHTLRHTFCTRMAENGMDIKVLQEIMGHKTIAVTMEVYNHISEDRISTEIKRVESALIV